MMRWNVRRRNCSSEHLLIIEDNIILIPKRVVLRRILINSLCKIREIDFTIELHRRMICEANVITYSVIIHALCDGSVDEAIKIFFEMIGKGICPDVVVYGSLINGLCGSNRLKEAVDFFDEMVI
ncbi:hypothetical protein EZV62_018872 [Acer yangbiense]|uniref:Pentatricopeptide repeat-containing protein n=1 Tax=Acer yangbiense TaxID=1000413 RepID=A0A5C7HBS6_9ROSI|nr:hypothetical protein EZV62_018872 [Acer yangbiense]